MVQLRAGQGIELRQLQLRHTDEVYEVTASNRKYLSEWLPWVMGVHSKDDTLNFISNELHKHSAGRGLSLGIWVEGNFAGNIGFNTLDLYHKRADIGYWLAESYTGRGIMTRSVSALMEYAFRHMELHRLEIRAAVGNRRSRSIPERLGFVQEGTVRGVEWIRDHYVDHVIYGMLAEEWRSLRST